MFDYLLQNKFLSPIIEFLLQSILVANDFLNKIKDFFVNIASRFKPAEWASMALNGAYIATLIPTFLKLTDEIGWALRIKTFMKEGTNPEAINDWALQHPGTTPDRILFYKTLQLIVCALYVPMAIGEIFAVAKGTIFLLSTLPYSLAIGYGLFIAYDVIDLVEHAQQRNELEKTAAALKQQIALENDSQKKLALQTEYENVVNLSQSHRNEIITKAINIVLLSLGLVAGLIGLGTISIGIFVASGPALLTASTIIFILKVINYFLPKDCLANAFSFIKNAFEGLFKPTVSPDASLQEESVNNNNHYQEVKSQNDLSEEGVNYNHLTNELLISEDVSPAPNDSDNNNTTPGDSAVPNDTGNNNNISEKVNVLYYTPTIPKHGYDLHGIYGGQNNAFFLKEETVAQQTESSPLVIMSK